MGCGQVRFIGGIHLALWAPVTNSRQSLNGLCVVHRHGTCRQLHCSTKLGYVEFT